LSSNEKDDEDADDESDDEEEEEESSKFTDKVKETLAKPIETVKNVASNMRNKVYFIIFSNLSSFFCFIQIASSTDEEDEEESASITEQFKESLSNPIETAKDLGEQVVTNVKNTVRRQILIKKNCLYPIF
jgi:hypothetical protein